MDNKPALSIIIVSWNVRQLLHDCLASLLADIDASQILAQVWVIDCASEDGSAEMVRAEFPAVRVIPSEQNLGFAGGNNAALRAMKFPQEAVAQPDAVLLLNPDTIVQPGALQAMLNVLTADDQIGIVGANLTFGDGSFQHGAYGFPGLWQLAIELFPLPGRLYESMLNGRYSRHLYDGDSPFAIDHPLGAAMLVRAAAIQQAGLLDEDYQMYVEEVDWAQRIQSLGWRAYCAPAAHIVHLGGQSTGQIQTESFTNLWRSRYRYYQRYCGPLKFWLAKLLVVQGMNRKIKAMPENRAVFESVQAIWRGQEA